MDLNSKIIYGLERLSEAFKTLLWEKGKAYGFSPIQIQVLIFVADHKPELCNVSRLAGEFNLTKPTVSDVVKILHRKGYLEKDFSPADSRRYNLCISEKGKAIIRDIAAYSIPVSNILEQTTDDQLQVLYRSISDLIFQLNQKGILKVQRTCYGCRFYDQKNDRHYCNLLKKPLQSSDIRLDCPEFEEGGVGLPEGRR